MIMVNRIGWVILICINRCIIKRQIVFFEGYPDNEVSIDVLRQGTYDRGLKSIKVVSKNSEIKRDLYGPLVKKGSLKYWYFLLVSRVVIITHGSPIKKFSKRQLVINLWHGFPFKDISQAKRMSNVDFNFLVSYNRHCSELFLRYFGISRDKILEIGSLRWKYLLKKKNSIIKQNIIVWLPTFRQTTDNIFQDGKSEALFNDHDLSYLDEKLGQMNLLCKIKLHPMENHSIRGEYSNILFVSEDINQLLLESSCLITDVSSVIVDYLALNRPIYIYFPDIKDYFINRGYNEYYQRLVEPHNCHSIEELLTKVAATDVALMMSLREELLTTNDFVLEDILKIVENA